MRFRNPCSRFRGMRFGWYVRFGINAPGADEAGHARVPAHRDMIGRFVPTRDYRERRERVSIKAAVIARPVCSGVGAKAAPSHGIGGSINPVPDRFFPASWQRISPAALL